ncbi:hypothetical protein CRG98_022316 [Punica granatum]|uniref:CCHC-type domain-containing protein n=1 Tax=Punica granatum TaxID=22663 RepID=A0A2I0JM00_PUNGR|nr:hypothetical protein CRG98_022316 [Punica granatum]
MGVYDMIVHLRQLYQEQARHERFDVSKALFQAKLTEGSPDISKGTPVLMVQGTKKRGKGKKKGKKAKGASKCDSGALKPKAKVAKDNCCFHCGNSGHWKRNCKDLRNSRSLAKGEVDLRVGNEARVAALTVGTYHLSLPTGLVLDLNDCYYVPAISRNIMSISCLDKKEFCFTIKNKCCSMYMDDIFYGSAYLSNGLYVLDLNTPVYNVETKRLKSNDSNPTYLWHCRLGHISENRISRLHKDGLLDSFDFESIKTCEPCLMGKMTKINVTLWGILRKFEDTISIIRPRVCAPEFNLVGARMRAPKQTRLGSIHLPKDARRTHVRRSRHLPFYDPKVEGQQVTRV